AVDLVAREKIWILTTGICSSSGRRKRHVTKIRYTNLTFEIKNSVFQPIQIPCQGVRCLKLPYQSTRHGEIYCDGCYKKMFLENFHLPLGYILLNVLVKTQLGCLLGKGDLNAPTEGFIM